MRTTPIMRGLVSAATLGAAMLAITAGPAAAQVPVLLPSYCYLQGEPSPLEACGVVWDDLNHNGIQDAGEPGLPGVEVEFRFLDDTGTLDSIVVTTDLDGAYFAHLLPDTYDVYVKIQAGSETSPLNVGPDDTKDSDGVNNLSGYSVVTGVVISDDGATHVNDFGFFTSSKPQPGTGTPGYWKNHPDAWPVSSITVGGVVYSKDAAIEWLKKVSKDKTTTIFASLVSAMLNVMVGNDDSCIASTIAAADVWMSINHVGSNVAASSAAWAYAEPLHKQMDQYNNGQLCAPHRN